jgi:FkbM family methyltransferase
MLKKLKQLFPVRLRMAFWAIQTLNRSNRRSLLFKLIGKVRAVSLLDALACCIDEGGERKGLVELRVRGIRNPIKLRAKTTDFAVFVQVILNEQYALKLTGPVKYILDAGANVGLASIYFLEHYPTARVIAIEPDPGNFEMCKLNLAGYSDRVSLVNAAVCSKDGFVSVSRNTYLGGREWATQVVPVDENAEIVVPSKTVKSFIDEFGFPSIDILKMDIEGSELRVFRDGETQFLSRTACCAVECHGEECLRAFLDVIERDDFEVEYSGELTIATRTNRRNKLP